MIKCLCVISYEVSTFVSTQIMFHMWTFPSSLLPRHIKTKIYGTIVVPFLLCGPESWSFTLRERVFDKGLLR